MKVSIKQYMTKRNMMIGLGIFIFAGLMACRIFVQTEATADQQESIAVTTVQTFEIDKQEALQLTGTVEGLTSSIISSRHSGRVESVNVENGQRVSAGQVLLSLDGLELNNAVRVAQNNVNQQEANLAQANADLERYETLYKADAVAQQKLEATETSYMAAQSALDNAKAELSNAQKQVADTAIASPVNGVVANRAVNSGQLVTAGNTLMTVEAIDQVYVTVNVAQQDIAKTPIGSKATVTVDTYPGEVFTGTVALLNPVASQDNRMFQVKIKVDNPSGKLLPGMFAQARIEHGGKTKVLAVPRMAIQSSKGIYYVFVNDNGQVRKKQVEIGDILNDSMEIKSGLSLEDAVIIDNLDTIKDGDSINATSMSMTGMANNQASAQLSQQAN